MLLRRRQAHTDTRTHVHIEERCRVGSFQMLFGCCSPQQFSLSLKTLIVNLRLSRNWSQPSSQPAKSDSKALVEQARGAGGCSIIRQFLDPFSHGLRFGTYALFPCLFLSRFYSAIERMLCGLVIAARGRPGPGMPTLKLVTHRGSGRNSLPLSGPKAETNFRELRLVKREI